MFPQSSAPEEEKPGMLSSMLSKRKPKLGGKALTVETMRGLEAIEALESDSEEFEP